METRRERTPGELGADARPEPPLVVRFRGTRGSMPSPGPDTVRYGGHTSCVEVECGSSRLVLDGGTGIVPLGREWVRRGWTGRLNILLTHYHWDHIQGLPFLPLGRIPGITLRLFGPPVEGGSLRELLEQRMSPPTFPVSLDQVAAEVETREVGQTAWQEDVFRVETFRVRHPSYTLGYRISATGRSVVYIPDDELVGGEYPVDDGWHDRALAFVEGADLLIHDSTWVESEGPRSRGWGHSTHRETLDLGRRGGVHRVCFFHHHPERSDEELDRVASELEASLEAAPDAPEPIMAREGLELSL